MNNEGEQETKWGRRVRHGLDHGSSHHQVRDARYCLQGDGTLKHGKHCKMLTAQVSIPPLLLASCVTLGKLLLYASAFSSTKQGYSVYFISLRSRLLHVVSERVKGNRSYSDQVLHFKKTPLPNAWWMLQKEQEKKQWDDLGSHSSHTDTGTLRGSLC